MGMDSLEKAMLVVGLKSEEKGLVMYPAIFD
jgi:hypothetical protein